ncbi:MAG: ABC transporter ATP-binding protein [bacterium]|nr:ABC transporter ATP-binding protein [bacterium]
MITHDVSVVGENCTRVAVMYAAKIVEYGLTRRIFRLPFHPYTIGLQNAFPEIAGPSKQLINIPGDLPSLIFPPKGCRFYSRCPFHKDPCKRNDPPLVEVGTNHFSACLFPEDAERFREMGKSADTWEK